MRRASIVGIALASLGLGLVGCASDQARYVYQDRESGVIAIPRNTPKTMAHAEALMEKHFPGQNYEVVRTVEVDTGGSRSTYEDNNSKVEASPRLHHQAFAAVKFNREIDRKQAESLKIAECRVIYHKRLPTGGTGLAFSESPEYTPKVYSDAVAEGLLGIVKKTTNLANNSPPKTKDDAVITTAGPIDPPAPPKLGGK